MLGELNVSRAAQSKPCGLFWKEGLRAILPNALLSILGASAKNDKGTL